MMRLSAALALVIDTEAPFEYPHAWQNVSGSQKRTNGSQNVKYSIGSLSISQQSKPLLFVGFPEGKPFEELVL